MQDRSRVIIVADGRVALMKRVRDGRTHFTFPGGGVEAGETPENAAIREAQEELGVRVCLLRLVAQDEWRGARIFFYQAAIVGGQFGTGSGPEFQPGRSWGSYQPVWVEVAQLAGLDVRPAELGIALACGSLFQRTEPLRLQADHWVYCQNLHLPEDLRVFTVPGEGIRRWDHDTFVYDVRIGDDAVLRHYSFANRWFEVNCSLNLAGQLQTEPFPRTGGPGAFDWAFNCDICTPHFNLGSDVVNVDLCLDVLVAADGRAHRVKDETDFDQAVSLGWIFPGEADGAVRGLAELQAILRGEGLLPFLDRIYPFGPVADAPLQPPMVRRLLAGEPLLQPEERRRRLQA